MRLSQGHAPAAEFPPVVPTAPLAGRHGHRRGDACRAAVADQPAPSGRARSALCRLPVRVADQPRQQRADQPRDQQPVVVVAALDRSDGRLQQARRYQRAAAGDDTVAGHATGPPADPRPARARADRGRAGAGAAATGCTAPTASDSATARAPAGVAGTGACSCAAAGASTCTRASSRPWPRTSPGPCSCSGTRSGRCARPGPGAAGSQATGTTTACASHPDTSRADGCATVAGAASAGAADRRRRAGRLTRRRQCNDDPGGASRPGTVWGRQHTRLGHAVRFVPAPRAAGPCAVAADVRARDPAASRTVPGAATPAQSFRNGERAIAARQQAARSAGRGHRRSGCRRLPARTRRNPGARRPAGRAGTGRAGAVGALRQVTGGHSG